MDEAEKYAKLLKIVGEETQPWTKEYGEGRYYTDSDEEDYGEERPESVLDMVWGQLGSCRAGRRGCRFFYGGKDSEGRVYEISRIFEGGVPLPRSYKGGGTEEGYELTPAAELPDNFADVFELNLGMEEVTKEEFIEVSFCGTVLHAAALSQSPEVLTAAAKHAPAAAFALLDHYDQSVLHAAATTCSVGAVEAIIQRDRSALIQRSHKGELPLHIATRSLLGPKQEGGDVRLLLLEQTPKVLLPQTTVTGGNLLHYLAMDPFCPVEHMERFLAAMPASALAAYDKSGLTPLARAVFAHMEPPTLRLLAAATPREVLLYSTELMPSPLELALNLTALDFGNTVPRELRIIVEEYARRDLFSDLPRLRFGRTPLHAAAASSNPAVVKLFCRLPQVRMWTGQEDANGDLPLEVAISHTRANSVERMTILVHNTDSRDLARANRERGGETPLHFALAMNFLWMAESIIERLPAEGFLMEDAQGRTPLYVAFNYSNLDNLDVLSSLIARHPAPPLTVEQWRERKRPCSAKIVLDLVEQSLGGFFDTTTKETWEGGSTPLHVALQSFNDEDWSLAWKEEAYYSRRFSAILSHLPSWMAEVSDHLGRTPIYKAVEASNKDATELLLDVSSADAMTRIPHSDECEPVSAIELAVITQQVELVRMFAAKAPRDVLAITTASGRLLPELVHSMTTSVAVDDWEELPLEQVKADLLAALSPLVKSAHL